MSNKNTNTTTILTQIMGGIFVAQTQTVITVTTTTTPQGYTFKYNPICRCYFYNTVICCINNLPYLNIH